MRPARSPRAVADYYNALSRILGFRDLAGAIVSAVSEGTAAT
jgi:hypothetical protein